MKLNIQAHRANGKRSSAKTGDRKLTVSFLHAFLAVAALAVVMATTGCAIVPPSEFENFVAQAPNKRIMNKVHITWEVRPDAAQYCRRVLQHLGSATSVAPIACATWSAQNSICTIITTPNPNHVVIGHEVRHCFEGNFH